MGKRSVLGRGLGALIPEAPDAGLAENERSRVVDRFMRASTGSEMCCRGMST